MCHNCSFPVETLKYPTLTADRVKWWEVRMGNRHSPQMGMMVNFYVKISVAVENKYLKTNFRRHYADLYYQVGQIISCFQRSFNKDFKSNENYYFQSSIL